MEDGGPSATARRVAAHRLGFDRTATGYGDPAADEALAADVVGGLTVSAGRMHDYLAARTAFFDRAVTGAIDRGVRQIVTGAAGYDGRALRYAKPGVRWFEVDHPATQRDKLRRLDRLGITAPGVRFVEAGPAGRSRTALRTEPRVEPATGQRPPGTNASARPACSRRPLARGPV